jgi:site-specific DNA recombinase
MQSTNGHSPRRAILYARVSTEEQARSGYSLAQQLEVLREHTHREGYEVPEEVTDPGQSGASLARPGMDRVRDLVAAGGISVVLAQERDRFSRVPAYHYLLKQEFEEYGCKLQALNDRGDDTPEGQLTDDILDTLAKFERAKTAERTRRGKLRKAREGKVIAGSQPDYGFKYNAARDGYEVDEEAMSLVRRIFRMVAVDGLHINTIRGTFEREGLAPPKAGRYWNRGFIRNRILDDVYKPHTFEDIRELVTPEVASKLDPKKSYGVWWFNQRRVTRKQVSEPGPNGRRYKQQDKWELKPKDEWIAVPVPDAGIPREQVEAAREAIKDNKLASSAARRFWELSGGIFCCGCCGRRMTPNSTLAPRMKTRRFYYRCPTRQQYGKEACPQRKNYRADEVEPIVWKFVSSLLKDPKGIQEGLDAMIEEEREGLRDDPERETKTWLDKLAEAERKRSAFQDMAAEGLITFDELRAKLAELAETRQTAQKKLEALRHRQERIEELQRDRDALLESYAGVVSEELDDLTPEERHRIYQMLRLRVVAHADETFEVSGAFRSSLELCNLEPASACWYRRCTSWG